MPQTLRQSMATGSPSSPLIVEEDERRYEIYLSAESTDTEVNQDTSNWSEQEKKKLQHMTEFHAEYQHVFGEKASVRSIMKKRICNMNPPMSKLVCEKEMQNAELDKDEVIIEFMTDTQGNKIKKLRPVFIKSDPDRDHVLHLNCDENLPDMPEESFTMERERIVDSYSEYISLGDEPSNAMTITVDSDSSEVANFEDATVGWELDPKRIKATLHKIAAGLKNASDGLLDLASCITHAAPYELLHIIAQVPPPPMNVLMPIRKALLVDGESKTICYLIHGE